MDCSREQVLRYRWRAQGLDATTGSVSVDDLPAIDLGIQDGANHALAVALLNRGVPVDEAIRVSSGFTDETALVWSVRSSPHLYRRADLPDVALACSPFDEDDARRRLVTAGKALTKAGQSCLEALAVTASEMRRLVRSPTSKSELSAALSDVLDQALLGECRPCACVHPHESLFRMAPLFGGLELEPGTNPPVLRRAPNWPRRAAAPGDPGRAPGRLQPIRCYLHLLGPATPRDVAAFLDTSVAVIKEHWPADAVPVGVDGSQAWILEADQDRLREAAAPSDAGATLRLLNGFDGFVAAKDRDLLADPSRHKQLWPVLGRPGVIAADGEIIGTWRPKSTKDKLTIAIELWRPDASAMTRRTLDRQLAEQGALIAAVRGQHLDRVANG